MGERFQIYEKISLAQNKFCFHFSQLIFLFHNSESSGTLYTRHLLMQTIQAHTTIIQNACFQRVLQYHLKSRQFSPEIETLPK